MTDQSHSGALRKIDYTALFALATASSAVHQACACTAIAPAGWERFPPMLALDMFDTVGTLVGDPYTEATFVEYHPVGTHYASADAPIAPLYYPANRCNVVCCRECGRAYLRYDEAGGYFTEARIRALQAALLVDAALPADA
jgi:hypothetical protein